jgi:hypothetical protein
MWVSGLRPSSTLRLASRINSLQRTQLSMYLPTSSVLNVVTPFGMLEDGQNATVKESPILWDITPCSQLNVNGRFGGTYRLHLQG